MDRQQIVLLGEQIRRAERRAQALRQIAGAAAVPAVVVVGVIVLAPDVLFWLWRPVFELLLICLVPLAAGAGLLRLYCHWRSFQLGCRLRALPPAGRREALTQAEEPLSEAAHWILPALARRFGRPTEAAPAAPPDGRGDEPSPE